jgi:hypothetical protein
MDAPFTSTLTFAAAWAIGPAARALTAARARLTPQWHPGPETLAVGASGLPACIDPFLHRLDNPP